MARAGWAKPINENSRYNIGNTANNANIGESSRTMREHKVKAMYWFAIIIFLATFYFAFNVFFIAVLICMCALFGYIDVIVTEKRENAKKTK